LPQAPILLALAAAGCFGLGLVLTQIGLRHIDPVRGAMISVPSAAALFWVLSLWMLDWHGFEARAAWIFAGVGLLFPATVTLLTFEANRHMGANVTGSLGNLTPVFAIALAVVTLGEIPSPAQLAGIAVILGGVMLLSWRGGGPGPAWPLWLIALPLIAAVIRGAAQPVVKLGFATWDAPFAAALIGYTVSATVLISTGWLRTRRQPGGFNTSATRVFILAGLSNGLATILMYGALAGGSVTLVSPLIATYPLMTLALSLLFVSGTTATPRLILGVAATVGGVIVLLVG
jgi:drug/metabolite transporter (DMT)-like permease